MTSWCLYIPADLTEVHTRINENLQSSTILSLPLIQAGQLSIGHMCLQLQAFAFIGFWYNQYAKHMQIPHSLAHEHLRYRAKIGERKYTIPIFSSAYAEGEVVWYLNEAHIEGISPKQQPAWRNHVWKLKCSTSLFLKFSCREGGGRREGGGTRVVHHNKLKQFEGHAFPKRIESTKVSFDTH